MLKNKNFMPDFTRENGFINQVYFVSDKHVANDIELQLIEGYKALKTAQETFTVLSYDYTDDPVKSCIRDFNRILSQNLRISDGQNSTHYVVIINDLNTRMYHDLEELLDAVSIIGMGTGISLVVLTKKDVSPVLIANSNVHNLK